MSLNIKKWMTEDRGGIAVEFVVAFLNVSVCLLIVLQFILFSIRSEVASYAAYMGSRALRVYGDAVRASKAIAPWVDDVKIAVGEENGRLFGRVTVKSRTSADVTSGVWLERQDRKECEDNPLWYIKGGEKCR